MPVFVVDPRMGASADVIEQGGTPLAPIGATTPPGAHRNELVGAGASTRGRLPARQPLRAIVLCLLYAAVVATAFVVLSGVHRPAMAILFAAGVALLLSVPLVVLVPVPRHQEAQADDNRPVLQRRSTKRAGAAEDAPATDRARSTR